MCVIRTIRNVLLRAVGLPAACVAINPILAEGGDKILVAQVNSLTLTAAGYVSTKGR